MLKQCQTIFILLQIAMASNFKFKYIGEYTVPGVENVHHISCHRRDRIWVSDSQGNLVLFDGEADRSLKTIPTRGEGRNVEWSGFHTVTQEGTLIYIDTGDNVIKKITPPYDTCNSSPFITTGEWEAYSIHSCRSGDILVGMLYAQEAKVMRYTNTGREIHTIKLDGQLSFPHYITENGRYICISDYYEDAVVMVNELGERMFSFRCQKPYGLCAYIFNQILVCDMNNETIKLLSHHSKGITFPSSIMTYSLQEKVNNPRALCWDEESNLLIGESSNNTVKIFKNG